MTRKIIINANIFTPIGHESKKGEEMSGISHFPDSFILIEGSKIKEIGEMTSLPKDLTGVETIDAHGCAVLPGFVDSHTHLVFGGFRADEFDWRLKGHSYMSIMERGGGIQSTVNETRKASPEALIEKALWFINAMTQMGVTTVEGKTGYGLSTESEMMMLSVLEGLKADPRLKVKLLTTFLGAHAVPKEYKGKTSEYVDLMIREMIPKASGRADFFDIFTEKGVFEIEDSRTLLKAAKNAGMKLKLHADEIVTLGGAELAAETGAVSADHLLHVSDEGVKKMAEAGVVATLLPLTAFALKEPYAPARKFIDAGCAVALATDLNPGSCFSGSIPLTIALACIYMGMTTEETLTAMTLNGAAALGLASETGSIEAGKDADIVILNFESYTALPYYVGMNCVRTTMANGRVVCENTPLPA